MQATSDRRSQRVVVLGGSVAGMLAARVLAPHHGRVTVVERDTFPAVGRRRKGVPQDRHVHSLHPRGQQIMERLLPGLTDELVARGAALGEFGPDTRFVFGRPLARAFTGHAVLASSRPLLEGQIRTRVLELDNVETLEACDALGLAVDDGRVAGVRVLRRRDGAAAELLPAEVVVDATGRQTRLPRWLEELGLTPPHEDVGELDVAYVSCRFARDPDEDDVIVNVVGATPPNGRSGGAAVAAEGDSIVVTLVGLLGEVPPTDPEELVEYAAGLCDPGIHDLIIGREPLADPVLMRIPPGRRRHYDRLDDLPEGLVPIGDALCSFNPAYGQGMSVAAVEAARLGDCLADGHDQLTARYLAAVNGILDHAWSMARGADAAFTSSHRDRRPLPVRLLGRYQRRLLAAAHEDPVVASAFLEVMGLVRPPRSLLRPAVVARVAAHAMRGPRTYARRHGEAA